MKKLISKILLLSIITGCSSNQVDEAASSRLSTPTITQPYILSANESKKLDLGSTRISPVDGMTQVFIAGGEFKMGSQIGLTDEQPQHKVILDSFWLDKTEITNALYNKCVLAGKCRPPKTQNSYEDQNTPFDYFENSTLINHPVVLVSWNDAKNYCTWAGKRLPTEAEWEKAAIWDPTSNEQRTYPWGNNFDCKNGNYDDEIELDASMMSNTTKNCDGYSRSSPVGSFPQGASAYGALDMGGNVWEWVNDAFIEIDPFNNKGLKKYYEISPLHNPPGVDPAISEYRILRGGSWNMIFGFGRGAYRLWFGLDDAYDGVGFRCASNMN